MRLLPVVLLNVVTAVVAVLVYDVLRSDPLEPVVQSPVATFDGVALENRLAKLEAERGPRLASGAADGRLAQRLDVLERRLEALAAQGPAAPGLRPTADAPPGSPAGEPVPPSPLPSLGDAGTAIDAAEVERFRKLRAAAQRAEHFQRVREHIDEELAQVGVALNSEQKDRLVAMHVDFESRRNEIWREVKARVAEAGPGTDWRPMVAETQQRIRREFAGRIDSFVTPREAELIAAALIPAGN